VLQNGRRAVAVWQGFAPIALATALVCLFSAQGLGAGLYRCVDASGESVFTDSPVQLGSCEPLEFDAPPSSAKPSPSVPTQPPRMPVSPSDSQPHAATSPVTAKKDGQVTVPVQRVGHLLIVSTQVNGSRDARLILDTGASHTILSHDVAGDLGLLSGRQTRFVTLKTAGGPVQAELVRVNSIRIADAEVRNSLVAVYDMPDAPEGVEGLLGLTFLKQFQVTLDTAKGVLHLRQSER
jgi:clan AA aspartic protease (TIGR02281 family)